MRWFACLALFFSTASYVATTQSHHSRSAFDLSKTITVHGVVTEVGWTNPHYYLTVRDDGDLQWTFEGHSIPGLVRNGWSRNTVKVGDAVILTANPNQQSDILFALLNQVQIPSGDTFYSFKPRIPLKAPEIKPSTDFSGTWRLIRSLKENLVSGSGAPRHWPLNERAISQADQFDPRDDPSLKCLSRGIPRMLDWPYAQHWQVTPEGIRISIEHAVEQRVLTRTEPQNQVRHGSDLLGLGHSRIVSQTATELIVETDTFKPKDWGLARGLDSSAEKLVREHYELLEGGLQLKLRYSVHDPVFLQGVGGETFYYAKIADFNFAAEPACDVATAQRHLEYE